ncbi:MAG: tetratricopeptide repeat protein [Candidatus Hodarchaeales archaeon]
MSILEIKELIKRGNYYQALEAIDNHDNKLNGMILKSRIFDQKGEVEASLMLAERAKEISKNIGTPLQQLQAEICRCYGLLNLQRLNSLEEAILRGEALFHTLSNESISEQKECKASLHYLNGILMFMRIESASALDSINESLTIRKEISDQQGIVESYIALGLVHLLLFRNPVTAIGYFKKSLPIVEKLGNTVMITYSLKQIMTNDEFSSFLSIPKDQQSFIPDRITGFSPEIMRIQYRFHQRLSQRLLRVPFEPKDEYELAIQNYEKYNELFNVFTSFSSIYQDIGWHLHVKGDLVRALHFYKKSLRLLENIEDNKPELGRLLGSLGTVFADLGKVDLALEYFKSSLNVNREIHNIIAIAYNLKEISKIHTLKGELALALEYVNESMSIFITSDWRDGINRCCLVTGVICKHIGKLNLAKSYLEEGWNSRNEFGGNFPLFDSYYLFHLILLAQEQNDIDKAYIYLKQLQKIQQGHESKIIALRYSFCEAIVLKMSKRTIDKFIAQQKFTEILEKHTERFFSNHPIFIMVMLNLCESLMLELNVTDNQEELFHEISKWVGISRLQAEFLDLLPLLILSLIIESRLSLVKGDLNRAQILLNDALELANEKKLGNLIIKVKNEKHALQVELNKWKRLTRLGVSIQERMKYADLEKYLREAKKLPEAWVQSSSTQPMPEDPVMIVFIAEGGITLFNRVFEQEHSIRIGLIGKILAAFDMFSKEVFSSYVDHVMLGDLRLAMQTHRNLKFAYVFRGESYPAVRKLTQFLDILQNNNILWEKMESTVNTGIALNASEEAEINGLLNNIFLSTGIETTGWFHSPLLREENPDFLGNQ